VSNLAAVQAIQRLPGAGAARTIALSRRARMGLVVLTGLAVLALRRPGALTHPVLWAEDGTIFLRQALTQSFPSTLVTPYADDLHLVPRLIAGLAVRLPFAWIPLSFTVASLVAATLAVTPALSDRLDWLIPSTWGRVALFAALILLPSVDEVAGNIDSLQWYFGITLVLLALSSDPRTRWGRVAEIVSVTVLGLTAPFCVPAVPVFWGRALRLRSRHSLEFAATLTAVAAVQGILVTTSHGSGGVQAGMPSAGAFVSVWGRNLGGLAVLGTGVLHEMRAAGLGRAIWLVSGGFLALVALCLERLPRAAVLTLAMVAAAGSATLRLRSDLVLLEQPGPGGRYYVLPLALIAIVTVAALARALRHASMPQPGVRVLLAAMPATLLMQGTLLNAKLPARADIDWSRTSRCVQQHRTCEVRLDPDGWTTTLPPL